jgi:uncharacterized membrane protein
MRHLLFTLFSRVCGENPQHIWSPDGVALPCCERCTGLYVAALFAVALHFLLRPRISKRFLLVHALCLLQLGLFAFPWLPDSAALRSISGALFGFSVVSFLWPAVSNRFPPSRAPRFAMEAYAIGLAASLGLIPIIAERGGPTGAFVLIWLISGGSLALVALVGANIYYCLRQGTLLIAERVVTNQF